MSTWIHRGRFPRNRPSRTAEIRAALDGRSLSELPPPPTGTLADWATGVVNFELQPAQIEILNARETHVILCCTRQFGKTTLASLKAAWHALTNPESVVVVGSPGERQSAGLVDRAAHFLRRGGVRLRGAGRSTRGVTLPNGSRIYALPAAPTTTRGYSSVSLLVIEEAAYVSDEFYHMASAYQAAVQTPHRWLISTAGDQRGFFYEEWSDSQRGHWRRFRVRASDCTHISARFLSLERISMGETIYNREYECVFQSDGVRLIPAELWDRAEEPSTDLFNGGKPLWKD